MVLIHYKGYRYAKMPWKFSLDRNKPKERIKNAFKRTKIGKKWARLAHNRSSRMWVENTYFRPFCTFKRVFSQKMRLSAHKKRQKVVVFLIVRKGVLDYDCSSRLYEKNSTFCLFLCPSALFPVTVENRDCERSTLILCFWKIFVYSRGIHIHTYLYFWYKYSHSITFFFDLSLHMAHYQTYDQLRIYRLSPPKKYRTDVNPFYWLNKAIDDQ
jgi:hypothetical protein